MRLFKALIFFAIIPLMLPAQGWIMEEEDGSITIISGDRVKTVDPEEDGFTTVFNLADRSLLIISDESRSYAEGSMDDYCDAIQAVTASAMEGMTPEQKKMMEAYMAEAAEGPAPVVRINKTDQEEEIAGYNAEKYEVVVDDELYEEIWISHDKTFDELVSIFGKVEPITIEMVSCASFEINLKNDPEYSDEYLGLVNSGMMMKSMHYEFGNPQPGTLITRIVQKDISPDEFNPPSGYAKTDFALFLKGLQGME